MRVVFMGTPEFALPSLRTLIQMPLDLVGVFTQPDRPAGRGHKLESPPVKLLAQEYGIPVYQFEKVRRQAGLDQMRLLKPDLVVTAAFGQILSKKLLDVPTMGTINVHASLLPKHRGAAPINWSIIQGDKVTGVTTMLTNEGLDTGDILLKTEITILPEETAGELTLRLAEAGAALLKSTIERYARGELEPVPQDENQMSYEPMMDKTTGEIKWDRRAEEIVNLVRGTDPWPGAYTLYQGSTMKIWKARAGEAIPDTVPGQVVASSPRQGLKVASRNGSVEIVELQMPGGKRMAAKAYLSGKQIDEGSILGE